MTSIPILRVVRETYRELRARAPARGLPATLLVASAIAGCAHKAVVSFNVDPQLSCPGKPVLVQWEVNGRASLHAEPAPKDWVEGATDSKGSRQVFPEVTTAFTVTALDANPAQGNSSGTKSVQVLPHNDNRAASSSCDETTHHCQGSFTLKSIDSLRVVKISNPTFVRSGQRQARDVCVTAPNGAKTCVKANQGAELSAPANGSWVLETELAPEEPATPPPQLRLFFDFGCP
jgi:hypothetical protein